MTTEKYLDSTTGKNISYVDNINYTDVYAKEVKEDEPKLNCTLDDVLIKFGFNDDIAQELHEELSEFIENEVRLSCVEFIKRLTHQLNQTKWGHCFLRALGFQCEGLTYKQAGEKFDVSSQYLHKLTNQIAESCEIEPVSSLTVIRKYSRNMKVRSSDDWYTINEAEKYLGVNSRKLKQLINDNNITTKGYIRNSKLIHIDSLTLLEKKLDK